VPLPLLHNSKPSAELQGALSLVQELAQELARISAFVTESGWTERA
jgi:glycine cleavage system protein P-like pyridoxal-binding family